MSGRALPPLSEFLRWLSETPAEFRAEPQGFAGGKVRVRAVVSDCLETLFGEPPADDLLRAFDPRDTRKPERNRLLWVLAACRLLDHPAWREAGLRREEVGRLLVQDLASLAAVVPAEKLLDEEERREELVRRTLASSRLLLPGETRKQAEDRLAQVDSVERQDRKSVV